ncbi:sensitive to high expression protein 9, mitochondrial [Podospora australis]|uniref:Sensitive to high expression protein 9, mitochondrial n=1 Tax=Podospora australis TaxID=1536484 RepID=A0AAN7AJR7_9PEZI|nr:sensitive to high expression protein 9, mitochondrial [Podospora australis]
MSPHAALRLAVRPLRGASILDQLAARKSSLAQHLPPPICFRCSITIGLRPRGGAAPRFYSTSPPPPKQPQSESQPEKTAEESTSSSSPSSSPEDASSTTPPSESSPSSSESEKQAPPPPPKPEPELPSVTDSHRHPLYAKFSTFMDQFQSRALVATQTINDLTGYSAIEAIKARNAQLEKDLEKAQARLRDARHNYKSLTSHRAATQREVTTLLARKDTWNPTDLERFTSLYRMDHELEAQVANASAELTEAEADESKTSTDLNSGILRRYHEEQIWSDRIRRQSTWGTWGLMGVNFVLFLILQFVAEPWKRKRMIKGIAENEKGVMEEVKRELAEVKIALETTHSFMEQREQERASSASSATTTEDIPETSDEAAVPAPVEEEEDVPTHLPHYNNHQTRRRPWKEILQEYWEDPQILKEDVVDLASDRRIDLRMKDVSIIALEGAAAGATVMAAVAFALWRYV